MDRVRLAVESYLIIYVDSKYSGNENPHPHISAKGE